MDIVLEGGLPVLIEMMHSADVETAHQSTGVVANLAEVVENQGKMVESGKKGRQQKASKARLRRLSSYILCFTSLPCTVG